MAILSHFLFLRLYRTDKRCYNSMSDEFLVGIPQLPNRSLDRTMSKYLFSVLIAALLSLFAISAHAGLERQHFEQQEFRTVNGEYLAVTDLHHNPVAFGAVVDIIQKAGYLTGYSDSVQMQTWCKVDIHTDRRVLIACYTPNADFDLVVSKHVWWTPEEFKAYADVPAVVAQLRQAHHQASAAIGTNTK